MIIFIIVITFRTSWVNVWCFCLYLVLWTKRHAHACTDVRRAEPCMSLKTIFHYFGIVFNSEIFQDLYEIFLIIVRQ